MKGTPSSLAHLEKFRRSPEFSMFLPFAPVYWHDMQFTGMANNQDTNHRKPLSLGIWQIEHKLAIRPWSIEKDTA